MFLEDAGELLRRAERDHDELTAGGLFMKDLQGVLQPLRRDDYTLRKINEAEERSRITKQAFVQVMKAGSGAVGLGWMMT